MRGHGVLLLTGATGAVGSELLPRLLATRRPVRCLVRDPARLGPHRVRVQLALGDLTDPPSYRNALRGVSTVVHLASVRRDGPRASIEEVVGLATWRLVEAARRAGAQRFVLLSALGASAHDRTRFLRAKALAEDVVQGSGMEAVVLAPGLVVAPGRPLLGRLALPLLPVPVRGRRTPHAPVLARDVAAAAVAALDATPGRFALAGPRAVPRDDLLRATAGRALLHLPSGVVARSLRGAEAVLGPRAPLTWDQVELLQVPQAGDESGWSELGVRPATAV